MDDLESVVERLEAAVLAAHAAGTDVSITAGGVEKIIAALREKDAEIARLRGIIAATHSTGAGN